MPAPHIRCGEVNERQLRRGLGVFVPGNYILKPDKQIEQGWLIGRKELEVYGVTPSNRCIAFVWPTGVVSASVESALKLLLAHVSYFGRTESQVRAFLVKDPQEIPDLPVEFTPTAGLEEHEIYLSGLYNGILSDVEAHWSHASRQFRKETEEAKKPRKRSRATAAERAAPPPISSEVAPFPEQQPVGYRRSNASIGPSNKAFLPDSDLRLLRTVRHVVGEAIPGTLAPVLAANIRRELVGRQRGGLLVVPLPFVEHPYADGSIKGVAFYRTADLGTDGIDLIESQVGNFDKATLPSGTHTFTSNATTMPTLVHSRWADPASVWASVTPVLLPRYPDKRHFVSQVGDLLSECCRYIGIREPFQFEIDSNGALRGVAPVGRFRLPDGYVGRPAFHVVLKFERPVKGPIVLGAGRFLGLGLCVPIRFGDYA